MIFPPHGYFPTCYGKTFEIINDVALIGLSKERPILDHHAKAHIHEIRRISYGFYEFQVKSARFCTDFRWNPVDFRWNPADSIRISGEIRQISYWFQVWFQTWNQPDFERPIARNGKPYVLQNVAKLFLSYVRVLHKDKTLQSTLLFNFINVMLSHKNRICLLVDCKLTTKQGG